MYPIDTQQEKEKCCFWEGMILRDLNKVFLDAESQARLEEGPARVFISFASSVIQP
jgi:hypothetical protein